MSIYQTHEAKDAEIERLKAELQKYQQSNKDHWDHLAGMASDLKYDNQVREGHLDVIRDQRVEIERLNDALFEMKQTVTDQSFALACNQAAFKTKDQLITELADWAINDSQIVSGCRDDYEKGQYETLREVIDRIQRTIATKQ